MIMYYYKLYYSSTLLRDSSDFDEYFEDEDEAMEEAETEKEDRIEQWKSDGGWNEDDSEDFFDIDIEYEERKDEEDDIS